MADEKSTPPPKQQNGTGAPTPSVEPEGQNEEHEESESEENNPIVGLMQDDAYHGLVTMEDVASLLKQNGAYLVRSTYENSDKQRIVLSVYWNEKIKDIEILFAENRGVTFDCNVYKNTILELIHFHRHQMIPVDKDGVLLGRAVKRQSWEIRRENIIKEEKIGEGAFGEVFRGKLKQPNGQFLSVAVKVPKSALGSKAIDEAMKEARIQKDYVHPNVVRLFGVSAEIEPLMIVLEYVGGGSLTKFLNQNRDSLTVANKAMYCFDVTCGLDYLHSRNCIHRDIAARNCLVCVKYGIVKISDFGLSSVGNVQTMDRTKPAPIRWLAPEVLGTAKYCKAADVWSLAITWWEIFTCAQELPFKNYTLAEIQQKLLQDAEFHPSMPPDCPIEIQKLALKCWSKDPKKRPASMLCTMKLSKFAVPERYMKIPGLGLDWTRMNKKKKAKAVKNQTTTKTPTVQASERKESVKASNNSIKKKLSINRGSASKKSKKMTSSSDSKEKAGPLKKKSVKSVKK
ncbi:Tyrosine-protein kinase [Aphelenchoides besseyi]|nr:Tyrosine-protein kinase [Aphelenchoides besseyi]